MSLTSPLSGHASGVALELKQIHKTYPGVIPVHALTAINLQVTNGSFSAIIGPSGSGKSTLLQIAAGLDQPSNGEVILGGQSLLGKSNKELCELRRNHAGFVFQAHNLFSHLTAVENVEFTCLVRGDDRIKTREISREALKRVGLSHKENSFPSQLSGGQQQRVAIARALASKPAIIFADEPTANLDTQTSTQLIDLFQELNETENATFLFVSHDSRLVDRARIIHRMKDGILV